MRPIPIPRPKPLRLRDHLVILGVMVLPFLVLALVVALQGCNTLRTVAADVVNCTTADRHALVQELGGPDGLMDHELQRSVSIGAGTVDTTTLAATWSRLKTDDLRCVAVTELQRLLALFQTNPHPEALITGTGRVPLPDGIRQVVGNRHYHTDRGDY